MHPSLRSLALVGGLFAITAAIQAQSFEGTIEFTKTTGPVVTNYKYYVKGDHVRIEELSSRGNVMLSLYTYPRITYSMASTDLTPKKLR